jgi:hypothetical protein
MSKYTLLDQASKEELLARYDNGIDWLDTHSCQAGTNNTLDVNGNLYDPTKYELCCLLLEDIEVTLDKRFPGWRDNRDVEEIVSPEKIRGFANGYFTLGRLNPSEQLQVLKDAFPGSKVVPNNQ